MAYDVVRTSPRASVQRYSEDEVVIRRVRRGPVRDDYGDVAPRRHYADDDAPSSRRRYADDDIAPSRWRYADDDIAPRRRHPDDLPPRRRHPDDLPPRRRHPDDDLPPRRRRADDDDYVIVRRPSGDEPIRVKVEPDEKKKPGFVKTIATNGSKVITTGVGIGGFLSFWVGAFQAIGGSSLVGTTGVAPGLLMAGGVAAMFGAGAAWHWLNPKKD